ncbi:MAG: DUF3050 domain-containing protein [Thioalkalispiraceae bacterium]|jgi:hypothetical protein
MFDVSDLTRQLAEHPIYQRINNEQAVRLFMRSHVFCVWDFQSLLKALQQTFTCVTVPWQPSGDREACRLVNEIVLEEESDEHPDGGYASHFEFYLEAMQQCGSDTRPITTLLDELHSGKSIEQALQHPVIPGGVAEFVNTTFRYANMAAQGQAHNAVSIFTYAREDLIPTMFTELVASLAEQAPGKWDKFLYYLNRHIEVDGERHGPISHALLARVCGDDQQRWREAEIAAREALQARIHMWDAILAQLDS